MHGWAHWQPYKKPKTQEEKKKTTKTVRACFRTSGKKKKLLPQFPTFVNMAVEAGDLGKAVVTTIPQLGGGGHIWLHLEG